MRKKLRTYSLSLLLLLILGCGDMPVNWSPSFDSTDTIPFGTYVLRNELKEFFPDSQISNITTKTIEHFEEIQYDYYTDHYIYIDGEDRHTPETWHTISNYVYNGGSAFISMPVGNSVLLNQLGISVDSEFKLPTQQAVSLSIQTPKNESSYIIEKGFGTAYFSNYNPETTDVLGHMTYNGQKHPNFIKIYHGDGYFLLHAEPIVFTNYYLLKKNNYQYVANAFSYLSPENIMWDNHRLHRRNSNERNDGGFFNGLSFIMKHEALQWALFLLITMGIMYLLFNSKRRQKAVPIVLPYTNYTLDFAKTLSELYRYHANHTAMVKYKMNYFLEPIRINYEITSKDTEKDFSDLLSAKSGVDIELCRKLVLTIDIFKTKTYLDKEDFFKLHALIQSFNQKSKLYGRTISRK